MTAKPERRTMIDPAVAELLGQHEQRQAERRLPAEERKRRKAEREKVARRSRVMYDIPDPITNQIAAIAKREGVSASQVVTWLIFNSHTVAELAAGLVDLTPYKRPSKSPAYAYKLTSEKSENSDAKGHP